MRFDLAPAKEGAEGSGPAQPIRILGDGSLAIPARISRTGCLEYASDEGPPFVEYRDPKEVFAQESLDSFKGITLTLLHPDSDVTPDNWRKHSIGHVDSDVRAEGIFVAATLIVKDPEAIKRAQSKDPAEWVREISCGYWADVKLEKGEYEGQKYDGVQTNIRGNHVALGPSDWGRSGPEVRIRVDSKTKGKKDMKYQEMLDLLAKLVSDGTITQEQADALKAALVDPDAEEPVADEDKPEDEDKPDAKADAKALEAGFQRSLAIRDHARVVMGPAFTMPKTDSEIMLAVIHSEDPKFDSKGREPAYVQARFDVVKPKASETKTDDAGTLAPFVSIFAKDSHTPEAKAAGTGNPIKDRQMKHYDKMTGKA